jgi:hypothetical protein
VRLKAASQQDRVLRERADLVRRHGLEAPKVLERLVDRRGERWLTDVEREGGKRDVDDG